MRVGIEARAGSGKPPMIQGRRFNIRWMGIG